MSRLWSDDSWAHAGRIAEAYESNKLAWEEAPTAQEATATIDCHVCGAEVGARCVDKPQNLNFSDHSGMMCMACGREHFFSEPCSAAPDFGKRDE